MKTSNNKPASRLATWTSELAELKAQTIRLTREITEAAEERFRKAGGCPCCKGEGTYTYRPTLDYMHEYETVPCIYRPDQRQQDGSYRGQGFRIDPNSPYCTDESRERTTPLLRPTAGEREQIAALNSRRSELEALIAAEERAARPKVNHMVRVVKGRKVARGDYQCVAEGISQYGPWLKLRAANGTECFCNADNCVGLVECPSCLVYGTTDELLIAVSHTDHGPHVCCTVCRDRLRDSGDLAQDA